LELSQRFSFGVVLTLAVRVFMAANSVLAGLLVARLLGAESLGVFVVLNVTVSLVIQLASFGLPTANIYFAAKNRDELVPAAINSILFALVIGGAFALLVWFSAAALLPGVPRDLTAVGLLSVPFQLITVIVTTLFLSQSEVKRFNFFEFLNQSFVVTNAVVALLILKGGLWTLVSFNTATSAAVSLLTVGLFYRYLITRSEETKWRSDFGLLRRMMRYAIKAHILWAATFLVYRLDLLIVNYFRGAAEASVYAVATQCTLFLLLLPYAVSHLLQGRVAATQDEGGEFTCRVARHTSMLLLAACILSVPGVLFIFRLYGPAFADLPVQLWILLPGVYFVGIQAVLAQHFVGTGLPPKLPGIWIIMVAMSITSNLIVVPQFGARGAAMVSTACYTLVFIAVFIFFKSRTGHKLGDVLWLRRNEWTLRFK
jgi:O-antigen/teichoic acid export membrane protein